MSALLLMKILAASAAYFLLGVLWYSGMMFGPEWKKLSKRPGSKKSRTSPLAGHLVTFFGMFLACSVLGVLVVVTRIVGASDGAFLGFVLGLAFTATTMLSEAVYNGQTMTLFLINASYRVLGLTLAGAILAPWG
jgi:hypothetical protein